MEEKEVVMVDEEIGVGDVELEEEGEEKKR